MTLRENSLSEAVFHDKCLMFITYVRVKWTHLNILSILLRIPAWEVVVPGTCITKALCTCLISVVVSEYLGGVSNV